MKHETILLNAKLAWQFQGLATLVSLFKITFRLSGRSLFIFSVGFDIDLRWLPCVDHRAAQEESDGRELQNKNQNSSIARQMEQNPANQRRTAG